MRSQRDARAECAAVPSGECQSSLATHDPHLTLTLASWITKEMPLKCGHCGATNSDSAKFCAKCAFRLPATASNAQVAPDAAAPGNLMPAREASQPSIQQTPADPVTVPHDDDATVILAPRALPPSTPSATSPLPSSTPVDATVAPREAVQSPVPNVGASNAPIRPAATPSRKALPLILLGLIALVLASGFVWMRRGTSTPERTLEATSAASAGVAVSPPPVVASTTPAAPVVPAPPVVEQPVAPSTAPVDAAAAPPIAPTTEVAAPPVTGTTTPPPNGATPEVTAAQKAALLAKAEKQKVRRETDLKRKAELDARRKQEDESRSQVADAAKARELDNRARQEDLARQAKAAAAHRTPQQVCADRPNFISRGLCESRECEKPEQAGTGFCVQMRERRAPKDVNY